MSTNPKITELFRKHGELSSLLKTLNDEAIENVSLIEQLEEQLTCPHDGYSWEHKFRELLSSFTSTSFAKTDLEQQSIVDKIRIKDLQQAVKAMQGVVDKYHVISRMVLTEKEEQILKAKKLIFDLDDERQILLIQQILDKKEVSWNNTEAITKHEIPGGPGDFVSGSTFTLKGEKDE